MSEKELSKLNYFFEKFDSIAFDDKAAEEYAKTRSQLEAKGIMIGPYDLQIAAIALVNDFTLVTHNTREFKRIENLKLEDWEM